MSTEKSGQNSFRNQCYAFFMHRGAERSCWRKTDAKIRGYIENHFGTGRLLLAQKATASLWRSWLGWASIASLGKFTSFPFSLPGHFEVSDNKMEGKGTWQNRSLYHIKYQPSNTLKKPLSPCLNKITVIIKVQEMMAWNMWFIVQFCLLASIGHKIPPATVLSVHCIYEVNNVKRFTCHTHSHHCKLHTENNLPRGCPHTAGP